MSLPVLMEELQKRLVQNQGRWVPQEPEPKQKRFLDLDCLEALYGGAAGGGKSSALLMGGLQFVDTPGYSAILFRRTFTDLNLPDGLMDRSHQWLADTPASWDGGQKAWSFPSGAKVAFGYLDAARDHFRYQGSAFQYLGFDELTQIRPESYLYMMSRLRRLAGSEVPLRVRSATNPGGQYHNFVKERFVDPETAEDRVFVPASIQDNPHLDRESYIQTLSRLDEITRAQLLDGLWITNNNGLVFPLDSQVNLIQDLPHAIGEMQYVLSVDLGTREDKPTTAFTVVGWHHYDPNAYVVRSYKLAGLTPSSIAEEIVGLMEEFGQVQQVVMDLGGLGAGYAKEIEQRFGLAITAAEKRDKLGNTKLLRGSLERGDTKLYVPGCKQLILELNQLWWDESGTGDAKGSDNHCADSLRYGWRAAAHYLAEKPPIIPVVGDPSYQAYMEQQDEESLLQETQKEIWE